MLYFVIETFIAGHIFRGLLYLLVAGPLGFLIIASIIRAAIELYMVIFRIAEDVDALLGVRDTLDKLSGLGDAVDQMSAVTSRIPFFKKLTYNKMSIEKEKTASRGATPGDSETASDGTPTGTPD